MATNNVNLKALLADRLTVSEQSRKSVQDNVGWIVQFIPCKHQLELAPANSLVEVCKRKKTPGTLLVKGKCPICNRIVLNPKYYVREIK